MEKSIKSSFEDVAINVAPLLADPTQQEAVSNLINWNRKGTYSKIE